MSDSGDKKDTVLKCPNCDEVYMVWDEENHMWQCLSCGYRITE